MKTPLSIALLAKSITLTGWSAIGFLAIPFCIFGAFSFFAFYFSKIYRDQGRGFMATHFMIAGIFGAIVSLAVVVFAIYGAVRSWR